MHRSIAVFLNLLWMLAVFAPSASAADLGLRSHVASRTVEGPAGGFTLPFPRSERAQSVWASGVCWSQCGAVTAWALNACLVSDAQGRCLKYADARDRGCQRQCRTSGGPLLPLDF